MTNGKSKRHVVLTVIGVILCVIFGTMLVANITIVVKGFIDPDSPPSIFGVTPMVVQSGSMSIWNDADDHSAGNIVHKVFPDKIADLSPDAVNNIKAGDKVWSFEEDYKVENEIVSVVNKGTDEMFFNTIRLAEDHIEVGDMVFINKVNVKDLKVGDVISFMRDKIVITHRIIKIETADDGTRTFDTKGDANLSKDTESVSEDMIIGIYVSRIAKIGDFAYFLQKPLGMIIFIGIPLLAFIIYDIISRQKHAKKENERDDAMKQQKEEMEKQNAEMQAELERLRKLAGENGSNETKEEPTEK